MKLLMIGMDGCHKEVFSRGWTPFAQKLIEAQEHLDVHNDLISRGWLEISLGKHAYITKALYDKPKADGTSDWTTEFSLKQCPGVNTSIKPLWQRINELGFSVGIMNVPTTFPAPKVNGFFVSGGGGGAPVTERATPDLCYPKEICQILSDSGYIVDDRLYQLVVEKKLNTSAKILKRLQHKNERRTEAFLKLNENYNVDFGFVVYKTASVVAETLYKTELNRATNPQNVVDESTLLAVREYYENFDDQLKTLHEAHPEAKIILVSDHGTVERKFSVNPNILLQQIGLQNKLSSKSFAKKIIGKVKEVTPFWLKHYIKKTPIKSSKAAKLVNFDQKSTSAFCVTTGDWNHGIYINDEERFGGPVKKHEIQTLKKKIIHEINSCFEKSIHDITCFAPGENNASMHFPDILLNVPDGYLTFDKSEKLVSQYTVPKSASSLSSIMKGDILSMKSHFPLSYVDREVLRLTENKFDGDGLPQVYNIIVQYFSHLSKKHKQELQQENGKA